MLKRSLSLQVVILAAFACEAGTASRYHAATLPGRGRRVTNTGASPWTSETQWKLDENLTLGTPDGEGPEVFGVISVFRVTSGPLASTTRDHLYYVVADKLDVPRLSRFRIIRPG